jgi:hypothetical protein
VQWHNSLPAKWKDGDFISATSQWEKVPEEFDLPPFLAKTGWMDATQGYGITHLHDITRFPQKDDETCLREIRGLGGKYLSSLKNLNQVHPNLLERLTNWRKNQ